MTEQVFFMAPCRTGHAEGTQRYGMTQDEGGNDSTGRMGDAP